MTSLTKTTNEVKIPANIKHVVFVDAAHDCLDSFQAMLSPGVTFTSVLVENEEFGKAWTKIYSSVIDPESTLVVCDGGFSGEVYKMTNNYPLSSYSCFLAGGSTGAHSVIFRQGAGDTPEMCKLGIREVLKEYNILR